MEIETNNINGEHPVSSLGSWLKASTQATRKSLTTTLQAENKEANDDFDYVAYYKEQKETAKKLDKYFEDKWIKRLCWLAYHIQPNEITIYYNDQPWEKIIIFNSLSDPSRFFKEINWELEELVFFSDEIATKKHTSIYEVWDYLCAHAWWVNEWQYTNYYIDKNGNRIQQLGEQTWKERFSLNPYFWAYEFHKKIWENSEICTIFNKKMEKIAEFEKKWGERFNVEYCNGDVCLCYLEKKEEWLDARGKPTVKIEKRYNVFKQNKIINEWKRANLEKDLKWEVYMSDYFKKQEEIKSNIKQQKERENIPLEKRFKDISHCEIVYENDDKSELTIRSITGQELYHLSDVDKINFYGTSLHVEYKDKWNGYIEIDGFDSDSNVLIIRSITQSIETRKATLINKNTWEKIEFNWYEWDGAKRLWKIISVFHEETDRAKIYDENLKFLWYNNEWRMDLNCKDECSDHWILCIEWEDWKDYIVSAKEGKIVTSYLKIPDNREHRMPWYNIYKKDWKIYLIVSVSWKWLTQVKIEQLWTNPRS